MAALPALRRVEKPNTDNNLSASKGMADAIIQKDTSLRARTGLSHGDTQIAFAPLQGAPLQAAFVAQLLGQVLVQDSGSTRMRRYGEKKSAPPQHLDCRI